MRVPLRLGICRCGSPRLRWVMVEAARTAIRTRRQRGSVLKDDNGLGCLSERCWIHPSRASPVNRGFPLSEFRNP